MSDAARLADEDARDSIARDLGSTLFVSAGAGSGKTTELVRRVVALVSAGTAIESIAAITFTEKAADELRQRVRLALLEQAAGDGDGVVQERCRTALDDLDQAALCTLHAFAQRILTAYPVEAGLPPALSVLDEIASELDFDQRFRAFYSELLGRPELERTVVLALELGITDAQLRTVAEQLDDNWDRVQRPDVPWPEPPALDLRPLVDAGRELLAASVGLGVTDKLAVYLQGWLPGWLEEVEELAEPGVDEVEVLDVLLHTEPPKTGGFGGGGWATTAYGSATAARAAAKGLVDRTIEGSALATTFDPVIEAVLGRLGDELARFTLAEAERRSRSGRLTFHDLLVLCRRLVRHPLHGERVRAELAQRYQALLLDEYQDTDPLQLDIVVAIATPPGADLPAPGQLFFVGDPKQSLYRFRRADIDLFLRTPTLVDADPVSLTTSFRATPPLIHWINHVFGRLITHFATDEGILAQPDFEALAAVPAPRADRTARHRAGRGAPPQEDPDRRAAGGRGGGGRGDDRAHPRGGLGGAAPPAVHRVRPGAPTSRSSSRPAPPWASSRRRCGRAASPTASTRAPSSTRRTRSGPCSWPCASSTTRRTSSPRSASCAPRSTAAATWTSTAGGCSGAAAGTPGRRGPSGSRTTTPSGTPWPISSSASARAPG